MLHVADNMYVSVIITITSLKPFPICLGTALEVLVLDSTPFQAMSFASAQAQPVMYLSDYALSNSLFFSLSPSSLNLKYLKSLY